MIDATGLKEAGKVLKESLYDSGDGYPYTPAYFEFVATTVIGAYLTARSGSSEFVVVDRQRLVELLIEMTTSVDLAKTSNPGIAAIVEAMEAALEAQR